ncbi:hypothetical protein E0Z07_11050 [Myroides odoratimimus]|uniref:Bor family protein n=1 Tax=Myroides TaxID=76831 RepID=UPI00057F74D7|nr:MULTISPECIES: Bor family protein [Myroides]AJA69552.1 Bor protein [Myroides sp. A21]MDM1085562.1 hypothetical protein [Myroides odoratimimus]MDM1457635.1 hypothetical protein [Myroides odoratimimus]MEC4086137.1 hypothetical protein [Myroides odoratimimus]QBK76843.1 hypothetical protein E0Z07_11050 [Myroides odoratimimus]
MKTIKLALMGCVVAITMTSCYTAKVAVGDTDLTMPVVEVNKKKNHALIAGLIPLNKGYKGSELADKKTNYVVKTQMSFVDGLLGCITFGIYTPTTTTIYVPMEDFKK